jgi:hypothetical protein
MNDRLVLAAENPCLITALSPLTVGFVSDRTLMWFLLFDKLSFALRDHSLHVSED